MKKNTLYDIFKYFTIGMGIVGFGIAVAVLGYLFTR